MPTMEELAERFGIDPDVAAVTLGLQLMAVRDGCRDAESAMEWAVERGYVVRYPEANEYRCTAKGREVVLNWALEGG